MSFNDPGHLYNLDEEQERKLRHLWALLFAEFFDLPEHVIDAIHNSQDEEVAAPKRGNGVSGFFRNIVARRKDEDEDAGDSEPPTDDEDEGDFEDAEEGALPSTDDLRKMRDEQDDVTNVVVDKDALLTQIFYAGGYDNQDVLLLRFLRARKWDLTKASEMVMNCLKWREVVDIRRILERGEDGIGLAPLKRGKSYLLPGKDKSGRPVTVIHVAKHDAINDPYEETKKFTLYTIETGRQFLIECYPQEQVTLIFDMSGFSVRNMDFMFVGFMIKAFEAYYPESLGHLLIVNAPWFFTPFWRFIKPLLDPVVSEKVRFCKTSDLTSYITKGNLPASLGGAYTYKYVPASKTEKEAWKKLERDTEGREIAEAEWLAAIDVTRGATKDWIVAGAAFDALPRSASSRERAALLKALEEAKEKRDDALEKVRQGFKKLLPWVHKKGLYHRTGIIKEVLA